MNVARPIYFKMNKLRLIHFSLWIWTSNNNNNNYYYYYYYYYYLSPMNPCTIHYIIVKTELLLLPPVVVWIIVFMFGALPDGCSQPSFVCTLVLTTESVW